LAFSVCALAEEGSLDKRVDGLQAPIDRVMSKAGIHFGGEFRSQFLSSTVSGDATDDNKKNESVEYTSVDFDIVARPNTAFSARAMFRLHQDWRNFFSDVQNPITTRWLSMDGALMSGIFSYNLGDYRKKLTPLTLWAPENELLFEPEIFAQGRELAMAEAFVGDNSRHLQGGSLNFKAELYPLVHEVEADVFGARLATRGTGESAPIPPGIGGNSPTGYWDLEFDRYLVGFNAGAQIIKGLGLGVSDILIYDHVNSYKGPTNSSGITYPGEFEDSAKYYSTSTNVVAGRLNFDNRAFMSDDFINFGIKAEFAFSSDKYHQIRDDKVVDTTVSGMAVNAGLGLRMDFGEEEGVGLSLDYVMNQAEFRNDAAQSPTFLQRAVMNNENGLSGLGYMNPFDAMYRSVFKYAPSQYFGGTKPYSKNPYTNAILTPREQAYLEGLSEDTSVSTSRKVYFPSVFDEALPGGMASSNRTGPVLDIDGAALGGALRVGVKAAMVTTVEEVISFTRTYEGDDEVTGEPIYREEEVVYTPEFLEFAIGASVDIAKFAPAVGPSLVIGGSVGMYNSKFGNILTNESMLFGGFVNWNFYQRFSILFGYQMLPMNISVSEGEHKYEEKYTFDNLAFGVNYKVADGGSLTAKLTIVGGKWEPVSGSVMGEKAVDYKAMQPEVYLTVKF
jgi:hypothetical protein